MYSACLYIVLIHFLVNSITEVSAISSIKGSTVELVCPNRRNGGTSLQWLFLNTTIIANDMRISPNLSPELRQRLSITGDHTKGEYHLTISNIMESDQKGYRCTSVSSGETAIVDLIVIVGPTEIRFQNVIADNKIPGIEGQDMTITCTSVGGQPPPDVKLVILGTTYTRKQSAHYTFKPIRSNDGSNVTCQAGYENINHYPLTTSANIYLELKPIVTPFADHTWNTEETKSIVVSCQSSGSRPAATIYWLLGQQQISVSSNSSIQSINDSSTNTYNVTSSLKYKMDRRYNRQNLTCRASNDVGFMERSLILNVKYAPAVTVRDATFSNSQSSRQIYSTLDSNPQVNNYKWHHISRYGEYIRNFSDNNQILTLPTLSEDQRYQDTGEYICTAENGIVGINGQLKQNGSGYVISNAPPVITADNTDISTQYGKFGKSTKVYVNVYSIPKYSRINWYIDNIELLTDKYAINEETTTVKDMFHGVKVQLDGYRVTLTISNLEKADFTNYTLRLYYNSGEHVQHEVTLESASAPETPFNFTVTGSEEASITVQWIPGYDGGQTQTFYLEYRITETSTWMFQEIKTSNQVDTYNVYTLSGLQDKTLYELRMYAINKFNQSQYTDIETKRTLGKASSALGGVIGGVAGGLVVVIAILILIAFVLFRRKTGSSFPSKRTRSHSDSEVEEGLKDNVLYEGSEPEGLKLNILYQSAGPDSKNQGPNAEYAEVSKTKKPSRSSNDEYAEVQKHNDMYAEVDKKTQQKNMKKKKQKDKKKPPKSGKTRGGALNKNANGEYANSGIPIGNMSDAKNQSAVNKKNDQGLEYADLTFGSQIPKGKQPVIHGDENRTIYSDVDHTKKAPPPPQESEYEETDIRHGKK